MNTEITGTNARAGVAEVFYDAECSLCSRGAARLGGLFHRRGFRWLPLQSPGAADRLGVSEEELRREMKLRTPDGRVFGGVNVLAELLCSVWWLWPAGMLLRAPGIHALASFIYRRVARNRSCFNGSCALPAHRRTDLRWVDFAVLAALPGTVGLLVPREPAWVFMWTMAFALFAGCKWLTCRAVTASGVEPGFGRTFAYLFAWPGMDAAKFLNPAIRPHKRHASEWAWGAGCVLGGAALIWKIVPALMDEHPLLAGWAGMIGIVLALHFGLFRILVSVWQRAGIAATPVMRSPLTATSLGDFWGGRWNTAFHELAHRFTFRPLRRIAGVRFATLLVFALSGLIHELVISLPAKAGYGLPTLYFIVQGFAVGFERSAVGRRLGLGRGIIGRIYMLAFTAAPAFALFHPWFIHEVILPFIRVLNG